MTSCACPGPRRHKRQRSKSLCPKRKRHSIRKVRKPKCPKVRGLRHTSHRPKKISKCGSKKKSNSFVSKCRAGRITRNPFFNFLRVYRKQHCSEPVTKISIDGAKCWCRMSQKDRKLFYKQACTAPKRRKKHSCGPARKRRKC